MLTTQELQPQQYHWQFQVSHQLRQAREEESKQQLQAQASLSALQQV